MTKVSLRLTTFRRQPN